MMIPIFSVQNTKFQPVISLIKEAYHKKALAPQSNLRLILLCGKYIERDENIPPEYDSLWMQIFQKLFNRANTSESETSNRESLMSCSQVNKFNHHYILAENILDEDFFKTGLDLLTGEKYLADIVDCIFIFLESYGTAAELGAFSIIKEFQHKIIVVNDIKYKNGNSFITLGPLKIINNATKREHVFYCDPAAVNQIFNSAFHEINEIPLNKFKKVKLPIPNDKDIPYKTLLYLICDLIMLLGPVDTSNLVPVVNNIAGHVETSDIFNMLSVAVDAKLIFKESYGHHSLWHRPYDEINLSFMGIQPDKTNEIRISVSNFISRHYPEFYTFWKSN